MTVKTRSGSGRRGPRPARPPRLVAFSERGPRRPTAGRPAGRRAVPAPSAARTPPCQRQPTVGRLQFVSDIQDGVFQGYLSVTTEVPTAFRN